MRLLKIFFFLLPVAVFAATPQFTNVTDADMKDIASAMGSNFTHNSLMGASKMGTILGFQVSLVAAQTTTPKLDDIAKRSSSELKNLYNAGLMGALGLPFGIALEATVMPTLKSNGASLDGKSFAVKWNINDVIPVLPVNLALRGVYSNANFSFDQTISGAATKIKNETTVSGVQLLFSPMFPVIEPYVGVGMLSSKDDLSGSASIFNTSFTTSQSASKTVSGTQILAGVEANLAILKLGLEYSRAFDNTRYGFKFGFGF